MEDFSFERLRGSQSSRREKTIQKTSKARVKLFLIFFRKSGKILHSKQYVNHLIDWAVNGHSVGSSWIYSLFLSSNMYWWRTIYSWVVCFFTPECGLTLPSFLLCLLKIIQKKRIKIRTLINRIISNSSDGFTNFLYYYESTKFSRKKSLLFLYIYTASAM